MPFKFNLKALVIIILIFSLSSSKGQTSNSTKSAITLAFENYFELDRENIYVQLDKDVFFTNEAIWFKGYVYNKKLNIPFYTTTNVYVQLIDESGAIINNQLLYSINGVFSGKMVLGKKFKSGYYYLQFYTNWMNNFEEDESFVRRIKIKSNNDDSIPLLEGINSEKINVAFYPEGGNFITNVSNTVGVKVTDANGLALANCSLEIIDSNNESLKSVAINGFGMGKFEITPTHQNYQAIVLYKDKKTIHNLLSSTLSGISLELNNYALEDKTTVKIKYNKEHESMYKNKTLFLVIQKNEKSNCVEFKLDADSCKKEFMFSNDMLFNGVNSIRIIDSELNEMAQRLLYKIESQTSNVSLNLALKNEERIEITGNSNWPDACLSATFLPTNTLLTSSENILTSLNINSYLNDKLYLKRDYFNEMNRAKKYELDLMLLNQRSNKYSWQNIKKNAPKSFYTFESGVTIKGVINSTSANLKKYRIQLKNLLSDVVSSTETIQNNEFFFENTNVTDSMKVYCDLINKTDRSVEQMNYYLTVSNNKKKYSKNFQPTPFLYPTVKDPSLIYGLDMSWFDEESILLKEVEIKKEKIKLVRQNQSGNSYLRGYKVGVDVSGQVDLLYFIEQNGFTVSRAIDGVRITSRYKNSLRGSAPTPVVFIDSRQLMTFDELLGLRLDDFDEVYISANAIVPSVNNNIGIIKLYKKQPDIIVANSKAQIKTISGGFELITAFENADYTSEFSAGFDHFGLIYWSPWILTDENGNLKITIENKNHKKVKLIIEGFSMDGKLISKEQEVMME